MYYIGVDLGGTNIATAVVNEKFEIVGKASIPTNAPRPGEEIAKDIAKSVDLAIENAGVNKDEVASIGIGSPGAVNAEDGVIEFAGNLGFNHVPLVEYVEKYTGKKAFVENDANAAAYGELIAGAGRGAKNFVAITLGTGVGGGISKEKDNLLNPINEYVNKYKFGKTAKKQTKIKIAELGNDAGIIGAAFLE